MKLHDLHPTPGSRKPSRRVGRGHGSGRGKTAGRGTKGQKSRAGGNLPAWFEGGQTPLHIRTPKLHGFRNRGRVEYAPINLGRLGEVERGTLVTPDVLAHDGLIDDTKRPVKILGVGDAPAGITIHAHAFSRSALDKLGAAGSTVQLLSWPDNAPIDERPPRPEGKRARAPPRRDRPRRAGRRRRRCRADRDRRQAGQARSRRCRRRGAGSCEDRGGRARRRGERKRAHGLIDTVVTAFRAPDIRAKLLFTLGILAIFRALTNVPIPNVNTEALSNLFTDNPLLGILNIFSGGGLAAASIIGLGVNPYINASIIMQLMRGVIPALDELSREGEYGRNRINQYTRMLTVPLAIAQAYGISVLLSANGVIPPTEPVQHRDDQPAAELHRRHDPADVAGRADQRARPRQRHQPDHLRRHRRQHPAADRSDHQRARCAGAPRAVHRPRGRRHRRGRLHQRGPAPHPGPVRQPRARPADDPVADPVPAAEGDDGGRDPDHLRRQHPALPGPDRRLLHGQRHRVGAERRDLDQHEPERPEQPSAVRDAVLPAGRLLHVLLHGLPVPARPDGRLPAQERWLHPRAFAPASRPSSSSGA